MKIKILFFVLHCIFCISVLASPNKVVITGTVDNSSWKRNYVEIAINRFGLRQVNKKFMIDETGNFKGEFKVTTSTDIWFDYRTNFLIAVHPGDSIHVILDGAKKDRPTLLKSIKFSGTSANLNQDIAMLQQLYYNSQLYTFTDKKRRKKEVEIIKSSTPDEYILHLTKLKNEVFNDFKKRNNPSNEAILWSKVFLNTSILRKASHYPRLHKEYNKSDEWLAIETDDIYLKMLPLSDSMLICGSGISHLVNLYHYDYARPHLFKDVEGKKIPYTKENPTSKDIGDSLIVNGIIKYTPDTLLRQMVLTEFFLQGLQHADISVYEKYIGIVNGYIKLPFLLQPLSKYYRKTKKSVVNPDILSSQILKESSNSTISGIIDSIRANHRNKVIYIDCWATWCGPCLSEFPNSKLLMGELKDKDVAFVYICLDSKEKQWKALIDRHQLKGEHYLLSTPQSDDLRKIFEIEGIPHYIIIDKTGKVLGKDYNLRPYEAKRAIVQLLKK